MREQRAETKYEGKLHTSCPLLSVEERHKLQKSRHIPSGYRLFRDQSANNQSESEMSSVRRVCNCANATALMTEPSCVEGVQRAYQEERGSAKRTRHVEKPKLGDGMAKEMRSRTYARSWA